MKRKIGITVLALTILFGTLCVSAMSSYGYYTWSGLKTGIRAWAYAESGYSGASVKITEGSYTSGWISGTDVSAEKTNNPFANCYKYYYYY